MHSTRYPESRCSLRRTAHTEEDGTATSLSRAPSMGAEPCTCMHSRGAVKFNLQHEIALTILYTTHKLATRASCPACAAHWRLEAPVASHAGSAFSLSASPTNRLYSERRAWAALQSWSQGTKRPCSARETRSLLHAYVRGPNQCAGTLPMATNTPYRALSSI